MKFPFGPLRPASSMVAGKSEDVCLQWIDFSLGFWIQPQLAKSIALLCAKDADPGVARMLKQDVQVFALRTWPGPASPSPNLRPGGRAPGSAPFPPRPEEGSS